MNNTDQNLKLALQCLERARFNLRAAGTTEAIRMEEEVAAACGTINEVLRIREEKRLCPKT